MGMKKKPDHIAFVLGELVGKKRWTSHFELHRVFAFWDEIVGPDVASQAQPVKMHGTVLWVEVVDSVWLQQLQYLKMAYVDNINKRFSGVKLTDIRFALKQHRRDSNKEDISYPQPGPPPSAGDLARFEETVATIDDPELKETMLRCWKALYHYKDR